MNTQWDQGNLVLGLLVELTSPLIHRQCEIDAKKQQVLIL